jgi:hypothetical protein
MTSEEIINEQRAEIDTEITVLRYQIEQPKIQNPKPKTQNPK